MNHNSSLTYGGPMSPRLYENYNSSSELNNSNTESNTELSNVAELLKRLNNSIKNEMIDCEKLINCFKIINYPNKDIIKLCNSFYQKINEKNVNKSRLLIDFNNQLVSYMISNYKTIISRVRFTESIQTEFSDFTLCIFSILFKPSSDIYKEYIKIKEEIPYDIINKIQRTYLRNSFLNGLRWLHSHILFLGLNYYISPDTVSYDFTKFLKEFYFIFCKDVLKYQSHTKDIKTYYQVMFLLLEKIYSKDYSKIFQLINVNKEILKQVLQFNDSTAENISARHKLVEYYICEVIDQLFISYFNSTHGTPINIFNIKFGDMNKRELASYLYNLIPQTKFGEHQPEIYDQIIPRLIDVLLDSYSLSKEVKQRILSDIQYVLYWNYVKIHYLVPDFYPIYARSFYNMVVSSLDNKNIVLTNNNFSPDRVDFESQKLPDDDTVYLHVLDLLVDHFSTQDINLIESLKVLINKYRIQKKIPAQQIQLLVRNIDNFIREYSQEFEQNSSVTFALNFYAYRKLLLTLFNLNQPLNISKIDEISTYISNYLVEKIPKNQ